MSRQLLWSVCLLGGALAIAAVMIALRAEPDSQDRIVQAPLVEVEAFTAASGAIPVMASGTVEPSEEVVVATQVSGRISYVNPSFEEGGIVPAGATLVQIEVDDFRNQVRIAQADVAAQDVAVLQAQEEVNIARDELQRFSERESGARPADGAPDQAGLGSRILPPADLAQGSSNTSLADADAPASPNVLATREPQLRSAKAARQRAAANLAVAELSLARTRATAPFRGLVRQESASVGTIVQPGQSLGSIVSASAFEVRLSLTQNEFALLPGIINRNRANVPASVYYEYSGLTYRWDAVVDRVDAILDANTRNVEVFLKVPSPLTGGKLVAKDDTVNSTGPAPPLLLGSFVSAEIGGTSLDSYAVIPSIALRPGNEIWLVRDGKLSIVPVRVIQRSDDQAYVTTPALAQGGQLVTSSLVAPVDGQSVRVAGQAKQ